MKKLFYEFFHISSREKIREKVLLARAAVTVGVTVFCLFAMGISAFAYFSHDVVSGTNVIRAANFGAAVEIYVSVPNGTSVEPTRSGAYYIADLKGNTEYVVTLQRSTESTAKTGFVIITADGCDKAYHTQQLGEDEKVTLYLKVSSDTKVRFLPHWGTSSFYGYPGENNPYYLLDETHTEISIQPPPSTATDTETSSTTTTDTEASAASDSASQSTDSAQQTTDSAPQSTDSASQSTDSVPQSTDSAPQSTDSAQQTTDSASHSDDSAPQPSDTEESEPTE